MVEQGMHNCEAKKRGNVANLLAVKANTFVGVQRRVKGLKITTETWNSTRGCPER